MLARFVKISVYEHDRAQTGTTYSGSVYSASLGKTVLGLFCLHLNTIGWSGHVQECSAKKEVWQRRSHTNNNDILLRTHGPYHRHKSTKSG